MRNQDSNSPALISRAYYSATISSFLSQADSVVLSALAARNTFALEPTQRDAWFEQIEIMRGALSGMSRPGIIAFEFAVPRVGQRIDVLVVLDHVVFVIEFKVGMDRFAKHGYDQVWDYALDLKNFHSTSHDKLIAPILVATKADRLANPPTPTQDADGVFRPICSVPEDLRDVMDRVLSIGRGATIDVNGWAQGQYSPTPTIIDAAIALYGGHQVEEISRSDADENSILTTSSSVSAVIREAEDQRCKAICFVTGVPGAGKTLVGLNIAQQHMNPATGLHSVFLSGNGPLVAVLREALARDQVSRAATNAQPRTKGEARRAVKAFIQNVHHFRDECLNDSKRPPIDHVALFDEAQRAWTHEQTSSFMRQKKKIPSFSMSEPEFLISCMDRHPDWAVVVCMVGGGQEINTGEAGIGEWIRAVRTRFSHWHVHISPQLRDSEYEAGQALDLLEGHSNLHTDEDLHLSVSMRSFRAERVSELVKALLDQDLAHAHSIWSQTKKNYPIYLTRDIEVAKDWIREKARGTERGGVVVSSQAYRLKPHAIDVRAPINPVHWFLHASDDVRSSSFLEDAATEFDVQGLELDWTCVVWDGDFRYSPSGWKNWSFRGSKWTRIGSPQRQAYQKNAYRVLLTRARQGMVICVPEGDAKDLTRQAAYYDDTFDYLRRIGFDVIE